METYGELIRTTIGEFFADLGAYDGAGVYVVACYPAFGCVYVGQSDNVMMRMRQHVANDDLLGKFLSSNMADTCGWRLDILTAPRLDGWMDEAEQELIRYFRPLVNAKMDTHEHVH